MKTQVLIVLMLVSSISYAQITPGEFSKQLVDKFQEMAKSKISNPAKDQYICKAIPVFKKIPVNNLAPGLMDAFQMLQFYQKYTSLYTSKLTVKIDQGLFPTEDDKVLFELSSAKKFTDFVSKLTGMSLGDLDKKDQAALRALYDTHPLKTKKAVTEVIESKLGDCTVKATAKMTPTKYNYPKVSWDLETEVRIDCPCKDKGSDAVKYANFLITAQVAGNLNTNSGNFNRLKNPKVELRSVICCSPKQVGMGEPMEDDNYNVSLPDHYIGVTGGISLTNDFDEVAYCVGVEYLYNATDIGDSSLFVGANVGYGGTSFMDWTSTSITAGGTVQLFSPLGPSGETQATNGISANYINGCNDNMGIVDDFTGYSITGNTGVNVQLTDNLALNVVIPLIMHQSLTYKPENGGPEYSTRETEVMVFKNSPIKVGARIGF